MNKQKSAKYYVLSALVPYTKANLQLTFKPSLFFAELEKIENLNRNTSKTAFNRAIKKGLIQMDEQGSPLLTQKGTQQIRLFDSKRLPGSKLMIIFDIPESERWKRRRLRALLKELCFKQIQKSVWVSEYDHRDYLKLEVRELELGEAVRIFECSEL